MGDLRHTCTLCGRKRYEFYMERGAVYAGPDSYHWTCINGCRPTRHRKQYDF